MRLIGGCPLFHHISILILNGKLCSRQFRTGGQIYLGNGDMRRLVFHHYGINGAILADCKGDVFCVSVSSRCSNLSHGIRFASNKFANDLVWLIGGCPLINHISILILDRDVCSRKLVSGCNVGLADVYMCRLIFHHNLINGTVSAYCKLNIYRVCKAVRCSDLSHGIGLAGNQFANDLMRLIGGCPLINHFTIFVLDRDVCSRKLLIRCDIRLADGDVGRLIFHDDTVDGTVLADCKVDLLCIRISVRSCFLNKCVGLASL